MYTSKYLPVEGEIKEGTLFFHPETGNTRVATAGSIRDGLSKGLLEHGWTIGKLFLISDDTDSINEGDIICNDMSWKPYSCDRETMQTLRKGTFGAEFNVFKVIGEIITPGIKEDEIIEEENWKIIGMGDEGYYHINARHKGEIWNLRLPKPKDV